MHDFSGKNKKARQDLFSCQIESNLEITLVMAQVVKKIYFGVLTKYKYFSFGNSKKKLEIRVMIFLHLSEIDKKW